MHQVILIGLGVLGFLLQAIVLVISGTRALAKMEAGLLEAIGHHRDEIDAEINTLRRECGEGLTALRAKVHEVELWARDEFVRKGSFSLVTGEVKALVAQQTATIDARLEQMAGKIEALQITVASAGFRGPAE